MVEQDGNDGVNWTTLCRRTDDPKLSYIEYLLDNVNIPHRRNGKSFHAPILEVPEEYYDQAYDFTLTAKVRYRGKMVDLDEIPDDDIMFTEVEIAKKKLQDEQMKRLKEEEKRKAEEFYAKERERLEAVPEEFRSFISSYAWDRGHSSGYSEVLYHIEDLISLLAPCIDKYTQRIGNP